ncbi:MAG: hypothetical protein K2X01_03980 [Cyanobacteria bacterium]|nr:hypothetical protein [Cyanobacteriota bacterium]
MDVGQPSIQVSNRQIPSSLPAAHWKHTLQRAEIPQFQGDTPPAKIPPPNRFRSRANVFKRFGLWVNGLRTERATTLAKTQIALSLSHHSVDKYLRKMSAIGLKDPLINVLYQLDQSRPALPSSLVIDDLATFLQKRLDPYYDWSEPGPQSNLAVEALPQLIEGCPDLITWRGILGVANGYLQHRRYKNWSQEGEKSAPNAPEIIQRLLAISSAKPAHLKLMAKLQQVNNRLIHTVLDNKEFNAQYDYTYEMVLGADGQKETAVRHQEGELGEVLSRCYFQANLDKTLPNARAQTLTNALQDILDLRFYCNASTSSTSSPSNPSRHLTTDLQMLLAYAALPVSDELWQEQTQNLLGQYQQIPAAQRTPTQHNQLLEAMREALTPAVVSDTPKHHSLWLKNYLMHLSHETTPLSPAEAAWLAATPAETQHEFYRFRAIAGDKQAFLQQLPALLCDFAPHYVDMMGTIAKNFKAPPSELSPGWESRLVAQHSFPGQRNPLPVSRQTGLKGLIQTWQQQRPQDFAHGDTVLLLSLLACLPVPEEDWTALVNNLKETIETPSASSGQTFSGQALHHHINQSLLALLNEKKIPSDDVVWHSGYADYWNHRALEPESDIAKSDKSLWHNAIEKNYPHIASYHKTLAGDTNAFVDSLPFMLFGLPEAKARKLEDHIMQIDYQNIGKRQHANEAELMLLLRRPLNLSPKESMMKKAVFALTALTNFQAHQVRTVDGSILSTWSDIGFLSHAFRYWRFDTHGREAHIPKLRELHSEIHSLFTRFGFKKIPLRATDKTYGSGYSLWRGKTLIEFRRGYLLASHPEHGTLIIRNSSKVFGRDTLKHAAIYSHDMLEEKDLTTLDPAQELAAQSPRFTTVLDAKLYQPTSIEREQNLPAKAQHGLSILTQQLMQVKEDYRRWKFNTEAFDLVGRFTGHQSPGFSVMLKMMDRWLTAYEMGIEEKPPPEFAFTHPEYPIYTPDNVYHWTPEHIREFKAYVRKQLTPSELATTDWYQFLKGGVDLAPSELVLLGNSAS